MCLVTQSCLTLLQSHAKARQALSMGFSRQEYWSGLPFLLLLQGTFPACVSCTHALTGRFFTAKPPGRPKVEIKIQYFFSLKTKDKTNKQKNQPSQIFFMWLKFDLGTYLHHLITYFWFCGFMLGIWYQTPAGNSGLFAYLQWPCLKVIRLHRFSWLNFRFKC